VLLLRLLLLNAANAGRDGQFVTLSYQLSSQKCLDDGWTVWPLARHCKSVDTHSLSDEGWEPYEPLYKVSRHGVFLSVLASCWLLTVQSALVAFYAFDGDVFGLSMHVSVFL